VIRGTDADTGELKFSFGASGPRSMARRVAVGDVNGDQHADIISANARNVTVYDGTTQAPMPGFFGGFRPFGQRFNNGIEVAVGDVNGDSFADVIVAPSDDFRPVVKVFSGKDGSLLHQLNAYRNRPAFRDGVRLAAGDFNGDGKADIVTQAGAGKTSRIKVFDGPTGQALGGALANLNPFRGTPQVQAGAFVAVGDVNGDSRPDLVAAVTGGKPRLRVFDGATGAVLAQTARVEAAGYTGGIRVATLDVNNDGRAEIVTGTGKAKGLSPHVQVLDGLTLQTLDAFFADPSQSFQGGCSVATGIIAILIG
jgi:hypothetical protein